jgi:hypothetical protein
VGEREIRGLAGGDDLQLPLGQLAGIDHGFRQAGADQRDVGLAVQRRQDAQFHRTPEISGEGIGHRLELRADHRQGAIGGNADSQRDAGFGGCSAQTDQPDPQAEPDACMEPQACSAGHGESDVAHQEVSRGTLRMLPETGPVRGGRDGLTRPAGAGYPSSPATRTRRCSPLR